MNGKTESSAVAISVIIPAYNAENTLRDAIDSALNQVLKDVEVIVVDDGSTDNTKAILCEYAEKFQNVKPVFSKNRGVSAARNLGIDIAKGEYISFLDADDLLEETMLQKMYDLAKKETADVVQCGRKEQYPDGSVKNVLPNPKLFGKTLMDSPEILGHSIFIWDKIYKTSIVQKNNIRLNEKILYAEEEAFMLQVFLHSRKICAVREALYVYSARRIGAATYSFDARLLDIAKGVSDVCDIAIKTGTFSILEKSIWQLAKGYYFRRVNDFPLYKNRELQKEIVDSFFALFDQYFWDWRKRLLPSTKMKRALMPWKRKYVNKEWMYAYINSPMFCKRAGKKTETFIKAYINKAKQLFRKIKQGYNQHKNAMRYIKYLDCEINQTAVLLSANSGSHFNGNIYYMAQYLHYERPDLKVYVVSNNIKRDFISSLTEGWYPEFVQAHSKKHIKLLATAKFLVSNTKLPTFYIKRPEQVYMNTWHGIPLKTLGKSMLTGKKDMALNQKEFFTADYLLYPNKFMMEKMVADFELGRFYRGKVLLAGYPRNCAFFDPRGAERIRENFDLVGKTVYVYMPTWRGGSVDSVETENYAAFLDNFLNELDRELDENIIVFVKLHHYVMRRVKISKYSRILPFPTGYETYKFLSVADGLITDYSSVFFDFANTGKEIILYTYDKAEYMDMRGTYFDMDQLSFPQFGQSKDLITYINQKQRPTCITPFMAEFRKTFCTYDCLEAPGVVTQCLTEGAIDASYGEIIDLGQQAVSCTNVIFMPPLNSPERKQLFWNLAESADENTIFSFFMHDVSAETDMILNDIKKEKYGYIIVPGELVATKVEMIKLLLYRKFHLFKRSAKKVYRREVGRIFPNIVVNSFQNYSERQKLKDIAELFPNGIK